MILLGSPDANHWSSFVALSPLILLRMSHLVLRFHNQINQMLEHMGHMSFSVRSLSSTPIPMGQRPNNAIHVFLILESVI